MSPSGLPAASRALVGVSKRNGLSMIVSHTAGPQRRLDVARELLYDLPRLALDGELLARFPEGYRHLAYLQTRIGYRVKPDMPGLDGPEVAALYRRGETWLAGGRLE